MDHGQKRQLYCLTFETTLTTLAVRGSAFSVSPNLQKALQRSYLVAVEPSAAISNRKSSSVLKSLNKREKMNEPGKTAHH